ncbi:hypothetical protein BJX66DRAFT_304119 [Aspergillus keveii]|uniref:Uncharacterized protein n=1 Tax=Aspergillus keveii TaxID=714993 RepID=A0ABR4G5M7_9EURO
MCRCLQISGTIMTFLSLIYSGNITLRGSLNLTRKTEHSSTNIIERCDGYLIEWLQ